MGAEAGDEGRGEQVSAAQHSTGPSVCRPPPTCTHPPALLSPITPTQPHTHQAQLPAALHQRPRRHHHVKQARPGLAVHHHVRHALPKARLRPARPGSSQTGGALGWRRQYEGSECIAMSACTHQTADLPRRTARLRCTAVVQAQLLPCSQQVQRWGRTWGLHSWHGWPPARQAGCGPPCLSTCPAEPACRVKQGNSLACSRVPCACLLVRQGLPNVQPATAAMPTCIPVRKARQHPCPAARRAHLLGKHKVGDADPARQDLAELPLTVGLDLFGGSRKSLQ